jgi:hypothetical protein
MSKRRNEKVKKAKREKEQEKSRNRDILIKLGVWDFLKDLNREKLLECKNPRIEITLGSGEPRTETIETILAELKKVVRKETFDYPLLGRFSTAEYLASVKPMIEQIVVHSSSTTPQLPGLLKAKEQISPLASSDLLAWTTLGARLDEVLVRSGRIDRVLYFLEYDVTRKPNGLLRIKISLRIEQPQKQVINTPTGPRPAFRCGRPVRTEGLKWVEWTSSDLGLTGENRIYPVYVQSHALDNLYQREARAVFIQGSEWIVHDWLWRSLYQPKFTPLANSGNKFLVDYYLGRNKIGYLVARRLPDVVLIETFLFLTMDGTPESDALRNHHRLTKADKVYLGLDKIMTFLGTDVRLDPGLVAALKQCGCGHLFQIAEDLEAEVVATGYAKAIREYLGMGAAGSSWGGEGKPLSRPA